MSSKKLTAGFTMIELLAVLAIGAILMAIVLPIAQGARRQYSIVETKARFHRLTLALEEYKAEYGHYPNLGASPISINSTTGRIVELLTGKGLDGGAMSDAVAVALNPNKISFLQFPNNELTGDGQIQDGFGQTNWLLYIDTDNDGFLDGLTGVRGSIGWQSSGTAATVKSW